LILYKFKSIDRFDQVIDIVLSGQLYCPTPSQLNDPLEGILGIVEDDFLDPDLIDTRPGTPLMKEDVWDYIGPVLDRYRVCCFSTSPASILMWAYYGGAHSGICFEIDVDPTLRPLHKVIYVDDLSTVVVGHPTVRLRYKLKHWEHEQEYRVTLEDYDSLSHYPVTIKSVILGSAIQPCYAVPLERACRKMGYPIETIAFTADGKAVRRPYAASPNKIMLPTSYSRG
jgi:hypothetical protein